MIDGPIFFVLFTLMDQYQRGINEFYFCLNLYFRVFWAIPITNPTKSIFTYIYRLPKDCA